MKEKNNDYLRKSDKEQRDKIYELQREVKKIQEEYDKKLKTVLLEKEREVKRKIFQGFTVKDKVYFTDSKNEYVPCPTCNNGKVKVVINNKEEVIKCPHCYNYGKNSKRVSFVRQGEISQVDFKTWYDESDKCTESKFYIKAADGKDSSQKNISNIFLTEEDANKTCELRNQNKGA